jgi:hypothetical protein
VKISTESTGLLSEFDLGAKFSQGLLPALKGQVDEARQRYNEAQVEWAATLKRNATSVTIENPQ